MATNSYDVTISWESGGEETISVRETETVLAKARRQELDIPFSCRWGACARCLALVLDGEFEYTDHPRVLEKYGYGEYPYVKSDSRELQYVLLCIAQPRTDCRIKIGPRLFQGFSSNPDQ